MKRTALIAGMVATLSVASAHAGTLHETARIKSIDAGLHKLVLNSGRAYEIPHSMKLSRFKKGDRVRVSFKITKGHRHLSRVRHIPVKTQKRHQANKRSMHKNSKS